MHIRPAGGRHADLSSPYVSERRPAHSSLRWEPAAFRPPCLDRRISMITSVVAGIVALVVVLIVVSEIVAAVIPLIIVLTCVPVRERDSLARVLAALDSSRRL